MVAILATVRRGGGGEGRVSLVSIIGIYFGLIVATCIHSKRSQIKRQSIA